MLEVYINNYKSIPHGVLLLSKDYNIEDYLLIDSEGEIMIWINL